MFDKLPKVVHQIWIGDMGNMSSAVSVCVDSVIRWCADYHIEYKLWDWDKLRSEFALDPVTEIFERALKVADIVRTYVIMSDYYRWAVTSRFGGLYIDTDFKINSTPDIPDADIVYCKPHVDNSPGNGLLWCVGDNGQKAAGIGYKKVQKFMKYALPMDYSFEERYACMLNRNTAWQNIGPGYLINVINPAIVKAGYKWEVADSKQINCYGDTSAPFLHLGERSWGNMTETSYKVSVDAVTGNVDLIAVPKVKLLVGVCSCKKNIDKRRVIRNTWMNDVTHDSAAMFFYAGMADDAKEDEVLLDCNDSYEFLPEKVLKFFAYCLDNYDFDYLFKCDDDTYVAFDRLHKLATTTDYNAVGYVAIDDKVTGNKYMSGGAGYLLSRQAVEAIVEEGLPNEGTEDVNVLMALMKQDITPVFDSRFRPTGYVFDQPSKYNENITCHGLAPYMIVATHDRYKMKY